jgi:hypothetical protein
MADDQPGEQAPAAAPAQPTASVPPPAPRRSLGALRRTPPAPPDRGMSSEVTDWAATPAVDPWAGHDTPWDPMPMVPQELPPTRPEEPLPPTRLDPQAAPPQAAPPQAAPPQAAPPQAAPPQAAPPQTAPPQAAPPQAGLPSVAAPPVAPPPARRRRWGAKKPPQPAPAANRIPIAPRQPAPQPPAPQPPAPQPPAPQPPAPQPPAPQPPAPRPPAPPPPARPQAWRPPPQAGRPLPPPPRRRRRWGRRFALFTLFSVVCCCGVPIAYLNWSPAGQYPVRAVLPASVADLSLRDDSASRRTVARLTHNLTDANAKVDQVFAGVYGDGGGKRVTIFGTTGFRLTPGSDVEAELDHLNSDYDLRDIAAYDLGEPGAHERCGVGDSGGTSVVVCSWADHGSLATVVTTRRSVADSAAVTAILRSAVLTRP